MLLLYHILVVYAYLIPTGKIFWLPYREIPFRIPAHKGYGEQRSRRIPGAQIRIPTGAPRIPHGPHSPAADKHMYRNPERPRNKRCEALRSPPGRGGSRLGR